MEVILLVLAGLILATSIYLLIRNQRVYKVQMATLSRVSALAQADIDADRDWEWRYDQFKAITYNQMLYSRKPVESFYENATFLR